MTIPVFKSYKFEVKVKIILFLYEDFYPLSFSPRGEKYNRLLPPWGKVGKGVND